MKLVITQNIALDGVVEQNDETGAWFTVAGDADMSDVDDALAAMMGEEDAQLHGRVTFEQMRGFWPDQTDDTSGVSAHLNGVDKYVLSRSMHDPQWENTTVLTGDLHDEVRTLKDLCASLWRWTTRWERVRFARMGDDPRPGTAVDRAGPNESGGIPRAGRRRGLGSRVGAKSMRTGFGSPSKKCWYLCGFELISNTRSGSLIWSSGAGERPARGSAHYDKQSSGDLSDQRPAGRGRRTDVPRSG